MRLVWTIKVYESNGIAAPFRAKISGTPHGRDQPWVNGSGKGKTQEDAYRDALASIRSGTKPQLRPND